MNKPVRKNSSPLAFLADLPSGSVVYSEVDYSMISSYLTYKKIKARTSLCLAIENYTDKTPVIKKITKIIIENEATATQKPLLDT